MVPVDGPVVDRSLSGDQMERLGIVVPLSALQWQELAELEARPAEGAGDDE